jgi:hypothetical protein
MEIGSQTIPVLSMKPAYALRNHSSVSRHRSREAIEVKGYHGRGVSDANSRSVPFVGADR